MSKEQNITFDHGWHYGEAKTFAITCWSDDAETVPLDLAAIVDVEWRLLKYGRTLVEKDKVLGITTTGAPTQNVANVALLVTDYAANKIPEPGSYRHELWDRTNDKLLTFGTALLQPGAL